MKKHILSIAAFLLCVGSISATPKYKKQSVPVEQRVEDLLKRMTLEEKIAQMQHIHAKHYNNDGTVDFERLRQNTGGLSRGCMEAFPYTPKHYVAHGSPQGGLNLATVAGGRYELYNVYLPPFKMIIDECAPLSIMNSYSTNLKKLQ